MVCECVYISCDARFVNRRRERQKDRERQGGIFLYNRKSILLSGYVGVQDFFYIQNDIGKLRINFTKNFRLVCYNCVIIDN